MAYRQNNDPYYAQQQPQRQASQPQRQASQPYQQDQYYNDAPQQPMRQNTQPYQQPASQQQYLQPASQQQFHQPEQPYHQEQQFHQQPDPYYNQGGQTDYASSNHDNTWDGKYQESFAGSQTHLDPYGMSQTSIAPVPQMPYAQSNYPPQRPGMPYQNTSGYGSQYSAVHEKMMKRRSVRQVELFQGNLVLDMPVPSHIVPAGKGTIEEFSKMRYTAATCDPDDFMRSKYSLRPFLYNRQTELFIVMTMYNS
jgi:chitin synthase